MNKRLIKCHRIKKMIVILGDSNIRQTLDNHQAEIEAAVNDKVVFEQVTTNEALKIALDQQREVQPWLFYISSILNEIAGKTGKGKPREETIRAVTLEQNEKVNEKAEENGAVLFLIGYPYLRLEPKWIEEKLLQIKFYMCDHVKKSSPGNVAVVTAPDITPEDLVVDRVHLTTSGKKKIAEKLISDIKMGRIEYEKTRDEDMAWEDTELETMSQKTPKTNKKRQRRASNEDQEENGPKKSKGDSEMMALMKQMMIEIRDGKTKSTKENKEIKSDINNLKRTTTGVQEKLQKIESQKETDNIYTATVREDLDAVENENMRNVVIIKKLKAAMKVPGERAELTKIIQKVGREVVKDVVGEDSAVIFVSQLYTGKEAIRITEGFFPPFKIVFKTKQDGMSFKEKAVQRSKDPKDKLHKSYLTTQQTLGTRIRTGLMWNVAEKVKDQEKGVDAWVTQNLNRPMLQVKGEEKFQRGYTFVNAMVKYGKKLDEKAKEEAKKIAHRHFPGQVEKLFLVIKD